MNVKIAGTKKPDYYRALIIDQIMGVLIINGIAPLPRLYQSGYGCPDF